MPKKPRPGTIPRPPREFIRDKAETFIDELEPGATGSEDLQVIHRAKSLLRRTAKERKKKMN